ncbi:helix-turn-helix transcriptional regulator [Pantoea cypripedii]|uniref:helix-turn-helix transcriptional regulator n=1 Tax=Pantoea cypripedii TaxID=55209 RepID=UPI002FCB1837
MRRSIARAYSRVTQEALHLLATMIRLERKTQKMTETELAQRAGISRSMLQRIEKADPKCEIGMVFEIAALLGIRLFDADANKLVSHRKFAEDKLSLLPQRIRTQTKETFDDF